MKRLEKQIALVTGGGSGIGKAACKLFASEGAKVAVVDIDFQKASETAEEIHQAGGEACSIKTDVSSKGDVIRMMDRLRETYGDLDILFNNAGTILPGTIEEINENDWDRLININLTSMFLCIKYAIAGLKKTKGKIINMGSMNGLVGQQQNPAYSATKGAIIALTRSLAIDFAPYNVRVNAICPAGVITPLLADWFNRQPDPAQMQRDSDFSHMLGRTASSEEVAQLALYLASSESSFITGQAIPIEGGATLGYGAGPKAEWEAVEDTLLTK
ncbi:NAD(P)-dependent dehydrogenase (short-subunit alcohol dehydrogenase family) [Scopulibacillus darangshiensis]|uniref:NAD(P)-dependent dehydrogenase (Short-subunit alcohol dehydrogenase family) n=1 Tax=Scopulibacillus darangshiensis TaxID=442528 RepID=A0A4V2SN29_9BACL|nr:SDR family oxidoreductase [Scopulibacillus darangshiensis]TCP29646.1 NAD(P)-dependent dehydrogenase (short-subunit alcohol dehydrogenase family) [Scopulibacillus darangshiensis]